MLPRSKVQQRVTDLSFVRLHALNLLEYFLQKPKVGIFFVKKNNGQLRMILDCPRSNCHF